MCCIFVSKISTNRGKILKVTKERLPCDVMLTIFRLENQ